MRLLFRRVFFLFVSATLLSLACAVFAQGAKGSQGAKALPGAVPVPGSNASRGPATSVSPQKAAPLLPPDFAGEPREGSVVLHSTPPDADAAHAAVLKEDGFVESTSAKYAGNGSTEWTVKVLRFGDATGAYSAFTFYRNPAMQPEPVGDNAAMGAGTFLVQSKAMLVIVEEAGLAPGNGQQDATRLRNAVQALVQALPKVGGPEAVAPALPGLMPADGLQKQTLHYAIGPASYNGPIPVSAIDFTRDAEAATALYRLRTGGTATLTLVMLPTPQIAGTALRTITGLPDASLHVATRRIGPLVGVVSGPGVSQADAQQLLGQIQYVADLTLDQPQGYISEVAKAAKLLLGIGYLTAFLAIAAVVIAIFLGAGRVLVRRMQGKGDSSMNDDEFISLKL